MKIATIIARTLLGLIFFVFGLNLFLHFIPMPPPKEELAGEFMKVMFGSHYMYVVGFFEALGGLILLTGRFTPLGLALVGPVIVNILCFHVFIDPPGLPMALVVSVLALFLLARNRSAFSGLLRK
jgi:uncharacterized membrane protein YphA (DoxX/SURF4 family)